MMLVEAYTQPIVQLMYLVCYYTGMTLKLYVSTKNEITDGKYISAKKLC